SNCYCFCTNLLCYFRMEAICKSTIFRTFCSLEWWYCHSRCYYRFCFNSDYLYTYKKISFWQIVDILAPSLIFGQAIGRWGNFMNHEAYGGPISENTYNNFHQYLPDFIMNQMTIDGVMYHPTFLYESFWNIIVFIFLVILRKFNPLRGEIFLTYAMLYSIGRFVIEGMRMDSLYMGEWRVAQLVSVLLVIGAIALIVYRRRMGQENYENRTFNKKAT